ncbi:DUF2997 domain-containing protein [Pueribacillus sp. YX66]|uniref:DUF2997 domain-containing protein n=1 Tax=Pueribacillus sp. YX66 TaxID=3229242 RepID=UPI00358D4115
MNKKIRFEITSSGEIKVKTIGMNDEQCLNYVEMIEHLLDAKTINSSYTEEFIQAQQLQRHNEVVQENEKIKGDLMK